MNKDMFNKAYVQFAPDWAFSATSRSDIAFDTVNSYLISFLLRSIATLIRQSGKKKQTMLTCG